MARFQARHDLDADGVVGRKTLARLNMTPAERVATIVANLERMRWIPAADAMGDRPLEANLAAYELVAYEDGKATMAMPVLVVSPENRTPILSDRIVNLKFAPTWTVPHRIAKNEILPRLQEDPGWLAANTFKVFADWGATVEIDSATIDRTRIMTEGFGFLLRPESSKSSALGLVRFSLTNEYDIFLHDTATRHVFNRTERSLSHGCVRVGDSASLAAEKEAWTSDEAHEAIWADDTRTTGISPSRSMFTSSI